MVDLARTFYDLVRFETWLWRAVDEGLQTSCGLSLARFESMRLLQQRGPSRVQDIAGELSITWSGASKVIDRVEAAGHAERRPNPHDARSSLVALTTAGQQMTRTAVTVFECELENHLAAGLAPHRLGELSESLSQLHGFARSAVGPARSIRSTGQSRR